jgi:hypothetical protein
LLHRVGIGAEDVSTRGGAAAKDVERTAAAARADRAAAEGDGWSGEVENPYSPTPRVKNASPASKLHERLPAFRSRNAA